MVNQFIESCGGITAAGTVLNVSGTIIHKWRKDGPSKKAVRRMELWLAYNCEQERFILRNIFAKEDRLWAPSPDEYKKWLTREFDILRDIVGMDRAVKFWQELST